MKYPTSDSTNTRAWAGEDWKLGGFVSSEDAEDLADGLATLRKYESEGADVFVKYRDYVDGL